MPAFWLPNSVTETPQPPGRTLKPSVSVQPAGRLIALVWLPELTPKSVTGAPSSVTNTLIIAEAATFAPESPAFALLRFICIWTSNSRFSAGGFFFAALAIDCLPSESDCRAHRQLRRENDNCTRSGWHCRATSFSGGVKLLV